jgi:hypothetical protein
MVPFALGGSFLCLILLGAVGCSPATRAWVHKDDMAKVVPWPAHQDKVVVRAKPRTTLANTCGWFGSYEEVEVTPDTTFYIIDETDKSFGYTPVRSPMRRLTQVRSIEIRWPPKKTDAETAPPEGGEAGDAPPAASPEKAPEGKPTEGKPEAQPKAGGQGSGPASGGSTPSGS